MRTQLLIAALAVIGFTVQVKAQDAFFADESASAEASTLDQFATKATVVVIAGTKKGKCTPEMPMLKPNVAYEIQLQATADKTFVLNSTDFNMHLKAAPGKTVSQVIIPSKEGNFNFICGDQALPEKQRSQGMFMVMSM
jgi:hypothetical protein